MSTVILALSLAALSSAAAFASNAISGIEVIVQFGIGGAIAILSAFAVLGVLMPKLLLATEEAMGPAPVTRGPRILTRLGFVFATIAVIFLLLWLYFRRWHGVFIRPSPPP